MLETEVKADEMIGIDEGYAELVEDLMPVNDVSLHFVSFQSSVLAQMVHKQVGLVDCYCLLVNPDVVNEEAMENWIPGHIRDALSVSDRGFDTTSIILRYLCLLYEHGVVDPKDDTQLMMTILDSDTWLAEMTWIAIIGGLEEAIQLRCQNENGDPKLVTQTQHECCETR